MQPTTDWPICHIAGGSRTFELLMKLGSALHSVRPNSGLTPAVTDSTQQRAKSFWRTRFIEPPSRLKTKSKLKFHLIWAEWKPNGSRNQHLMTSYLPQNGNRMEAKIRRCTTVRNSDDQAIPLRSTASVHQPHQQHQHISSIGASVTCIEKDICPYTSSQVISAYIH